MPSIFATRALRPPAASLACAVALAIQSAQRAAATTVARKIIIGEKPHYVHRAREPSRVHQVIDGTCRRPRVLPRTDRPRRSRDAEAEMLLLAAERSQIRQRPRLLRQSREEPEGERPR